MGKIYSSFMQNYMLPIYDIIRKTSRFRVGRILERTQWLPREEVERLQQKNLRALLRHAYNTVPYYRRIFRERKLSPSDVKYVPDLAKLPVLTKALVRENFSDLVSQTFSRSELIPCRSGGTGDQFSFFITRDQQSWEIGAEFRAYRWAGYRVGDKCVLFWGSPIDLAKHKSMIKRFSSRLERIAVLNTYVLSEKVLGEYVSLTRRFNPEIIRGYASSVHLVARYMLEKGVSDVRPKAVITSAESLLDFQRKTIEKAFGCKVFDYYGSREVGAIAAECVEHHGYHISAENVVLEFVRDGEQVAVGENGKILVTSLRNFGMPLIRYDIGDVGGSSDDVCACGRGLPMMSSIEGRVNQFMAVYDKQLGCVVPVGIAAFIMALMQVPLESYRIVQESLNGVVIKAVKAKGYSQKHTDFIVAHFRKILGDNVSVEFEFLDYLPPLPSGKRSVFSSQIDSFEN